MTATASELAEKSRHETRATDWHKCDSGNREEDEANARLIAAAPDLKAFLRNDQWEIIDRAIERYSAGEISDLHALGLISAGFMKLDADRQAALAKASRP